MNDLKARGGVEDILIAVVDGLKGFPDAIKAVFPQAAGSDLNRPSHPQFAGFRVVEGPQTRRRRTAQNLPRRGGLSGNCVRGRFRHHA